MKVCQSDDSRFNRAGRFYADGRDNNGELNESE